MKQIFFALFLLIGQFCYATAVIHDTNKSIEIYKTNHNIQQLQEDIKDNILINWPIEKYQKRLNN